MSRSRRRGSARYVASETTAARARTGATRVNERPDLPTASPCRAPIDRTGTDHELAAEVARIQIEEPLDEGRDRPRGGGVAAAGEPSHARLGREVDQVLVRRVEREPPPPGSLGDEAGAPERRAQRLEREVPVMAHQPIDGEHSARR